jgi:hypothetical protein
MPLIFHAFARSLNPDESTPRLDLISLKKFQAEGKLEEVKTVLGWIINTRTLLISLPVDKYSKWSNQISLILSSTRENSKQLEILFGRLNHVASIQNVLRHFQGHLPAFEIKWMDFATNLRKDGSSSSSNIFGFGKKGFVN